jgi:hypothetical protein
VIKLQREMLTALGFKQTTPQQLGTDLASLAGMEHAFVSGLAKLMEDTSEIARNEVATTPI